MIRLYFFCLFFDWYHARLGGTFQYYDDEIDKNEFLNHIFNERHFGEDIRYTYKRWIHRITGFWVLQGNNYTLQKTRRMVYDLLEIAKANNYLIEKDGKLRMDSQGREFIYNPFVFLNAVFKQYGYFTSFIFGAGGTILIVFWDKIIDYLANL